jgi:hypothetical protein
MGKSSTLIRFAFGSHDNPLSAVWRVNIAKKGDVYIHNIREFAGDVHFSLHASGKWSFKLGSERHKLQPPWKDSSGNFWGPVIFYRPPSWPLPAIPLSAATDKIEWLGTPDANCLFLLKLMYSSPNVRILPAENERLLVDSNQAKLFHDPMHFSILLQHRRLTADEMAPARHLEHLDFGESPPDTIELVRVSKTPQGPSAIIFEPYTLNK